MSISPVYRCLLDAARERGVNPAPSLLDFGLDEQTLAAADTRLSPETARALTERPVREVGEPEPSLERAGVSPNNQSVVERARAQLGKQLDSQVGQRCFDLGSIAAQLGTSERTLRRRLREAGTGYRELIDEVRRERAMRLVEEGAHSVTTISMLIGFADVTTFTRAFRRWTGTLPSSSLMLARARVRTQSLSRADSQPAQPRQTESA